MSVVVQVRLRYYSAVTPLTGVSVNRLVSVEVSDEEAKLMLERDHSKFFKKVDAKPDMSLVDSPEKAPAAEPEVPPETEPAAEPEPKSEPIVEPEAAPDASEETAPPTEEPKSDATEPAQPESEIPAKRGRPKKFRVAPVP